MPVMIENVLVYTLREVAKETGLTAQSIRSYANAGRIRYVKLGAAYVFSDKSVREFIAARHRANWQAYKKATQGSSGKETTEQNGEKPSGSGKGALQRIREQMRQRNS